MQEYKNNEQNQKTLLILSLPPVLFYEENLFITPD